MTDRFTQAVACDLLLKHLPARTRLPMWLGFTTCDRGHFVHGFDARRRHAREPAYEERATGTTFGSAVTFFAWSALVRNRVGKAERRRVLAALETDIRAHEHLIVCRECGKEEDLKGYFGADECARERLCFTCHFWTQRLAIANEPTAVRENGRHYSISPENASFCGFRGFGGSQYIVTFTDGRRVRSSNLWSSGEIPWWFRDRLPDNAAISAVNTATEREEWAALDCIPAGVKTPARTGLE